MTQQMSEVPESLGVLQTKGVPTVADGPVLALFAEDSLLCRTHARLRIGGAGRARSSATRLRCHLNFYCPLGPLFGEMEVPSRLPPSSTVTHPPRLSPLH